MEMAKLLSLSVQPCSCSGGCATANEPAGNSFGSERLIGRWVRVFTNNARLIIGKSIYPWEVESISDVFYLQCRYFLKNKETENAIWQQSVFWGDFTRDFWGVR